MQFCVLRVPFTVYTVLWRNTLTYTVSLFHCCHSAMQVHVKVSVPKGIKFVGHPGKHHLTRKKCVAPGEAAPTFIVLSFTDYRYRQVLI